MMNFFKTTTQFFKTNNIINLWDFKFLNILYAEMLSFFIKKCKTTLIFQQKKKKKERKKISKLDFMWI